MRDMTKTWPGYTMYYPRRWQLHPPAWDIIFARDFKEDARLLVMDLVHPASLPGGISKIIKMMNGAAIDNTLKHSGPMLTDKS